MVALSPDKHSQHSKHRPAPSHWRRLARISATRHQALGGLLSGGWARQGVPGHCPRACLRSGLGSDTDIHFMCITTSWRYKHFCGDFTHVIHKKNFGDTQKIRNNFDVIQIFFTESKKNMLGLFISLPLSVNVGPGQRLFSAPGGEEVNNPKGGPTHPPRR